MIRAKKIQSGKNVYIMSITNVRGSLDQLILNHDNLYEGNLVRYFQIVFHNAKNVNHPYHNFRHMMHVTWLCHDACKYYKKELSKRDMRNLLVASVFHDFDHRGTIGEDLENIKLAVQALNKYILPEDVPYLNEMTTIIKSTEYPYKEASASLALCCQIIRDADLSQSLSPAWLQQVIFGLAVEWKKSPMEVLKLQTNFHRSLKFNTDWAKKTWPQEEIEKKIEETTNLLKILEMDTTQNI